MAPLLYKTDKKEPYVPGFSLNVKSRNVLVKSLGIEGFGHGAHEQVFHGYQKLRPAWKGRVDYGGIGERRVGPGAIDDYTGYRIVVSNESFLGTIVAGPKRLTGPIQFLMELLKTWHLTPERAGLLLGQEAFYEVEKLLRGDVQLSGRDAKDRMTCLFRIRKTLSSLFRDEDTENEWLRERHGSLGGRTPMELLLEGSMENMLTVKEYVDWTAGR